MLQKKDKSSMIKRVAYTEISLNVKKYSTSSFLRFSTGWSVNHTIQQHSTPSKDRCSLGSKMEACRQVVNSKVVGYKPEVCSRSHKKPEDYSLVECRPVVDSLALGSTKVACMTGSRSGSTAADKCCPRVGTCQRRGLGNRQQAGAIPHPIHRKSSSSSWSRRTRGMPHKFWC